MQVNLNEKKLARAPNNVWSFLLHVIRVFVREAEAAFVSLKSLTTIFSEQRIRLQQLVDSYCQLSGMQGPLDAGQIKDIVAS